MTPSRTEYMREYRKTPQGREANRRNAARSRARRKLRLLDGRRVCERCGLSDVRALEFHHPDPSQKEHLLGKYKKWDDSHLEEARRCEILCSNCHTIHHTSWDQEWLTNDSNTG